MGRSLGSGVIMDLTMATKAGSTEGMSAAESLPDRRYCHVSPDVGITAPVAISNTVAPDEKMSAAGVAGPFSNSGARYDESPSPPSCQCSESVARPKSPIFKEPSFVRNKLAGLTSKWIKPWL